jgi:cytochrome c
MNHGAKVLAGFCLAGLLLQPLGLRAQKTAAKLHKEPLAASAPGGNTRASFALIKEKVDQACDLLTKEGKGAFPKFKEKNSEFIFDGAYVWVHDLKGVMRLDPGIPQMEGMGLIDAKDGHDKRPFFEMNKVAKEKGAGWVAYWWPKPGNPAPSRKISYVKLCQVDGEDMVVGAGVYDLTDKQIDDFLQAQKTSPEPAKEPEAAAAKTGPALATPEAATLPSPPLPTATQVKYVGSKTSNKYHYPDCKWAKQIRPERLLGFRSAKEAREKDYIPCPTCKPPLTDNPGSE